MAKSQKSSKPKDHQGPKVASKPSKDAKQVVKGTRTPVAAAAGVSRIEGTKVFLRDVRGEMRKVTWPTRVQLLKSTGAVLLAIVVLGAYIGVLDFIFRSIAEAVGL